MNRKPFDYFQFAVSIIPRPDGLRLAVICSWCPDSDERTSAAIAAGHLVSHTICPSCTTRIFGDEAQ